MSAQAQAQQIPAFESDLDSITQPISLSEFIQQYVRKYFNNCHLYCSITGNLLRYMQMLIIDSEFNCKRCEVWLTHSIEFSDYDDDSDVTSTIRVYPDGTYKFI